MCINKCIIKLQRLDMHMYICMSLPCRAAAHVLSDHIAEPEPGCIPQGNHLTCAYT